MTKKYKVEYIVYFGDGGSERNEIEFETDDIDQWKKEFEGYDSSFNEYFVETIWEIQ